jgi:hypothetical protein
MPPLHIDISGLGNSGKAIVSDFLSEHAKIRVPRKDFEFNLVRVQDGLIDLHQHLHGAWSPIRAHFAVARFMTLVRRFGARPLLTRPSELFNSCGFNYEDFFPGFFAISDAFIRSLVDFTYEGLWPYERLSMSTASLVRRRVTDKLRGRLGLDKVHFASGTGVTEAIRHYLSRLFLTALRDGETTYVTHNAFEPYCYPSAFELAPDSKAVLVVRDPRDIYANIRLGSSSQIAFYKKIDANYYNISAARDVESFVKYQRVALSYLQDLRSLPTNVLVVDFTQFILDYDRVAEGIRTFLGLRASDHIAPKLAFDPSRSIANVGIYKRYEPKAEIDRIVEALADSWNFAS